MRHGSDRPAKSLQPYVSGSLIAGSLISSSLMPCLLLGVLLLGCSPSVPAAPDVIKTPAVSAPTTASQPDTAQAAVNMGQRLPLSAQMKVADQVIQLEVAHTPEQQEIGLMNRTDLPNDRGMVFPFEPPRRVGFWMKNTLIPLDMVFLLKGKVQSISSNVPPCKADPCPIYGPNALVDQVIELRAGRAMELGIKQGDRVTVQKQ